MGTLLEQHKREANDRVKSLEYLEELYRQLDLLVLSKGKSILLRLTNERNCWQDTVHGVVNRQELRELILMGYRVALEGEVERLERELDVTRE